MQKLTEWVGKLKEKWKETSLRSKIIYCVLLVSIPIFLVWAFISLTATKYEVLFSNVDQADQGAVIAKLKEKKVAVKYQGNSLLVPKEQADQLRMEIMAEVPMTHGSEGFEILDKSKFGATDAEMKINYQRALQGTLERTIKGFPQVEDARVLLVLPQDTVFNKDVTPGSASVYVSLKSGMKLSQQQVKGIVSLICGGVRNIPKENVKVVDSKMNVLTDNLFNNDENMDTATSTEKQQLLKRQYEKETENKVLGMLEPVYGKGKVKVTVNADLNFDSVQNSKVTYDPKGTVVSEHTIQDSNGQDASKTSMSPVDNNMQNTISNNNTQNGGSSRTETTKNYNITKSEDKVIKAPGEVKRITTSVVIDGNLDERTKMSVNNLVVSAVGINTQRGDTINVEGMRFNTAEKDAVNKEFEDMQKKAENERKMKLYTEIGVAGLAGIGLIIFLISLLKKRHKNDDIEEEVFLEEEMDDMDETPEGVEVQKSIKFKPIQLDVENERTYIENEIKKYAQDKPEQVVDIVKSWLAEDER